MNKSQLIKNLHNRVRLCPMANREDEDGNPLPAIDEEWIIREITNDSLTLANPRTKHQSTLGLYQIASYANDPRTGSGTEKCGVLRLHVQLTLKGGDVRVDFLTPSPISTLPGSQ